MSNLYYQNPEIEHLQQSLFSSILMEQQKINAIKAPDPEKLLEQEQKLAQFAKNKGRGFFYPFLATGRGHGPFVECQDGSVKYDLINAIGVNLLGHSHPLMIRSHLEAALCDTVMCGNLLSYPAALELTEEILKHVVDQSRLRHFWLACSGSMANDTALKILWQKKAPNYKLIAFEKSFAGRSIGMQNVTHNRAYCEGMPDSLEVKFAPFFNQKDPDHSLSKSLEALERIYQEEKGQICALSLEIIQGEGGFIFGPKEYYQAIFQWAKEKQIYIWVDEVQTFMRTRQLFAFQDFELDSYVDVVTVGKALQACGTLYTEELNPKPGLISGTFNGSISALTLGTKTLKYLTEGPFFENKSSFISQSQNPLSTGNFSRHQQLETLFLDQLEKLQNLWGKEVLPYFGGRGTMIAFEVGDASKTVTQDFIKSLYQNGVISFLAGENPCRVRFLLPLALTGQHIDEIFKIIHLTLEDIFSTKNKLEIK